MYICRRRKSTNSNEKNVAEVPSLNCATGTVCLRVTIRGFNLRSETVGPMHRARC